MHELWSSTRYEPHLLSLAFAFAPAAMSTVIAYAIVMRGASVLRGWLLAHFVCLVPYGIAVTLAPSLSAEASTHLFKLAAACVPMAAITGAGFQLALVRRLRKYRRLVFVLVGNAVIWMVVSVATDATVSGVRWLDSGLWFAIPGPWAWLGLVNTFAMTLVGFLPLGHAALRGKPSDERRQQRQVLAANVLTYSALVDTVIAYGVGSFPIGWLLTGIGSLLVVRALIVDNLLRVRAVDTSAPRLIAHLAAAILLGWLALSQLGTETTWWEVTAALALCFAGTRVTIAVIGLINRGARGGEGPLERLLGQLVGRSRSLTAGPPIAQLAIDIVELGIGSRPQVLLASVEDWGWTTATGARLADDQAPDPLLGGWLAERRTTVFADELGDDVPADLRDLLAQLFERTKARAIVPVGSHDELLGLIAIPRTARRMRGRSVVFVERAAERLAEALLHARMAQRAAERAQIAREVELAATVQAELLPGKEPRRLGDLVVIGSWKPATRCAGDFWGVYPLDGGRTLIAIGDVTGHGVASAMVTAAAVGACEVAVRRGLDLGELTLALDAAVRRVGAGELSMTCFVSIVDPAAGEIRFVSCGHTAPYLCRPKAADIELHALVGRGNPLGTGVPTMPKVVHRPIQAGDLVVWYTDGVIEAQNAAGEPFGDRRLQRLLRKLERPRLTPVAVHALVQAGVAAHRSGMPLADDETLVVAQLAGDPA
ncbi:MAG TPA: PP2C family protein-serine/threonine phosphatase [Kofleriaceae bacterium]|nr:PP2C family protein-serine/threonine phosphatase [Kofleriaceae bacterium]